MYVPFTKENYAKLARSEDFINARIDCPAGLIGVEVGQLGAVLCTFEDAGGALRVRLSGVRNVFLPAHNLSLVVPAHRGADFTPKKEVAHVFTDEEAQCGTLFFRAGDIIKMTNSNTRERYEVVNTVIDGEKYKMFLRVRNLSTNNVSTKRAEDFTVLRSKKTHVDCYGTPLCVGDRVKCIHNKGMKQLRLGSTYFVASVRPYEGTITVKTGVKGITLNAGYAPWRFEKIGEKLDISSSISSKTYMPTYTPPYAEMSFIKHSSTDTPPKVIEFAVGELVRLVGDSGLTLVTKGDIARVCEIGKTRIKIEWETCSGINVCNVDDLYRQDNGWYGAWRFVKRANCAEFSEGD